MKTMNVVIILLSIIALFVTGYIFIKKSFPASPMEDDVKYSFPVSKDVPKPMADPEPIYDLPSANIPEPDSTSSPQAEPVPEPVVEPAPPANSPEGNTNQ